MPEANPVPEATLVPATGPEPGEAPLRGAAQSRGPSSSDAGVRPARRVWALRGATTVDEDTAVQVTERTQTLLRAMLERNGIDHDQIISVLFTATDDIHSLFPATAARGVGFGDIPLICARELDIEGSQQRCVRVLMHIEMWPPPAQLHHVYLEGARGLRDDLPE